MNSVGPKVRKINVQNTLDSGKDMLRDGISEYPIYSINTAKIPTFSTTVTPPLTQKQPFDRLPRDHPHADQTDLPLTKRIENFSEIVSIVGLRYAFIPNSSRVKRLLWLCLVMFGGGFMIYQIHDRVITYLSWPTTVDLRIKYNATLRFPSVTICNENRMGYGAASKLGINFAAVLSHSFDLNSTNPLSITLNLKYITVIVMGGVWPPGPFVRTYRLAVKFM